MHLISSLVRDFQVAFIFFCLKQLGGLVQAALGSWASISLGFGITGSTDMHGFNLIDKLPSKKVLPVCTPNNRIGTGFPFRVGFCFVF